MGQVQIVKASAGSGKTFQLAYTYIRKVIEQPLLYRHILAVTFTNKATEEMKRRIIEQINALASGQPSPFMAMLQQDLRLDERLIRHRATEARTYILHDYSRFTVVTIDKFFQRIIRSFIKEMGIDVNFNLELQTDSILSAATDRLIEEISSNPALREWILSFVEEKIDDNKKWEVKGELMELGKEIFKEQYKNIGNQSLSKADLNQIISEATLKSNTTQEHLRGVALQILREASEQGFYITDFSNGNKGVMGYVEKLSKGEVTSYGKRVQDARDEASKWVAAKAIHREEILTLVTSRLQPLLQELCTTCDRELSFITTTKLIRKNFRNFALLSDLAVKIQTICTEQNLLPISETNSILGKLIADNDAPFIFEKVGNHYAHYLIDEFQDTSALQWSNFVPLLENALSQSDESPVMLVGDVKQSIYRWRGGDWRIMGHEVMEQFAEIIPSNLESNYRSAGAIVTFNNALIAHCVANDNTDLNGKLNEALEQQRISPRCRTQLTNMLQSAYEEQAQLAQKPLHEGYVRVVAQSPTKVEHTPLYIQTIEELQQRGYALGDIAVLVRYNKEGAIVAQELLKYKATHPDSPYRYDVVTSESLAIGRSPLVVFIIACFSLSANFDNRIQRALYNQHLSRTVDTPLSEKELHFFRTLRLLPPEEAFERVVMRYGMDKNQHDIAYLQALHDQIITFSNSKIADIPLFLIWWEESGTKQYITLPKNREAITIISIHKAKGLEYKAVIIPFCDWELNPSSTTTLWAETTTPPFAALQRVPIQCTKSMGESYYAEDYFRELVLAHIDNINTFYVATTRAEEELHVFIKQPNPKTADKISRISSLINAWVTGNSFALTPHTVENDPDGLVAAAYSYGTPYRHTSQSYENRITESNYPTREIDNKIRFKMDTLRYFDDSKQTPTLSPRSYGIIMHRLFASLNDITQIDHQLQLMRSNGTISENEQTQVKAIIDKSFANPTIRSWYDPLWKVRNENSIISPNDSTLRRPDRVLTKGDRAIVIDYKFGLLKRKEHTAQLHQYMELIRQMGYRHIQGYLWYVEQEEIEEIS